MPESQPSMRRDGGGEGIRLVEKGVAGRQDDIAVGSRGAERGLGAAGGKRAAIRHLETELAQQRGQPLAIGIARRRFLTRREERGAESLRDRELPPADGGGEPDLLRAQA